MQVIRTESKIQISRTEMLRLSARLAQIMPRDRYSSSPDGYEVRTLYFDTLGDRSCVEKEDGLRFHEKIRVRIYGTDDRVIKLESKRKDGAGQVKQSMLISREMLRELVAGHYGVLLNHPDPMALYFYRRLSEGMMPKTIIQYQRLSYCLNVNNVRITFDYNIRATEASFDLFADPLLTHPILAADQVILEVKFNHFLPGYLKKALQDVRRSPTSFSKYYGGRTFHRTML